MLRTQFAADFPVSHSKHSQAAAVVSAPSEPVPEQRHLHGASQPTAKGKAKWGKGPEGKQGGEGNWEEGTRKRGGGRPSLSLGKARSSPRLLNLASMHGPFLAAHSDMLPARAHSGIHLPIQTIAWLRRTLDEHNAAIVTCGNNYISTNTFLNDASEKDVSSMNHHSCTMLHKRKTYDIRILIHRTGLPNMNIVPNRALKWRSDTSTTWICIESVTISVRVVAKAGDRVGKSKVSVVH